jgi:hypothetical protein
MDVSAGSACTAEIKAEIPVRTDRILILKYMLPRRFEKIEIMIS